MMSQRASIKIIKRGGRQSRSQSGALPAEKGEGSKDFTRQLNSTVAGWVRDFQQRRQAEEKRALRILSENRATLPNKISIIPQTGRDSAGADIEP